MHNPCRTAPCEANHLVDSGTRLLRCCRPPVFYRAMAGIVVTHGSDESHGRSSIMGSLTTWYVTLAALMLSASACDEPGAQEQSRSQQAVPATPIDAESKAPAPEANAELANVDADKLLARARRDDAHVHGLVVNMWASWCGSCREEIPLLLGLRQSFAAEGLDFAFVSVDEPQQHARAIELMKSWSGPLPVLVVNGSFGAFKRGLNPKWRGAIPATFLFDAQGKLRYFWEGPILEHEIAPVLQGFLAGAQIDGELRTAAGPP